jgi:cytochrome c oxidase subunit 4
MSHHDKPHTKVYLMVFVALMFATIVTVGVSYLHLSVPMAITVALIVATIKGALVALYFMHLNNERKLIYSALLLTVVFWVFLMFLPFLTERDTIGTKIAHPAPAPAGQPH